MNRVNLKPLSINEAYRGKRTITTKYEAYKRSVGFLLPSNFKLPLPPYHIHLRFGFSSKLSDWDNCIKTTQDCIANKYRFNDKLIRKGTVETEMVKKGKEFFEFEILTYHKPFQIQKLEVFGDNPISEATLLSLPLNEQKD